MKARFLKAAELETLREAIASNLQAYRKGTFEQLALDGGASFEIDAPLNEKKLAELKVPSGAQLFEVENCLVMYEAMGPLAPYHARDERLWTYLTHTLLLEHSRMRWPIPSDDEDAVSHIAKHFFAKTLRGVERDNAASRLWWMAHLCKRVSGLSHKDSLKAFLHRSDVRANIVERPTISQSEHLFAAIVMALWRSFNGKQSLFERAPFRRLMIEINSIGGFKLLDAMSLKEAEKAIEAIVKKDLKLTAW